MFIDIFLITILIIWLIAASISDLKTREVPNWLSYSLITIAIISRLLNAIFYQEFSPLIYSMVGLVIFLVISLLLYYTKQWGGGDAKLLMGIGATIPLYPTTLLNYFNPNLNVPFLIILFLNILIIGAIYGLLWTLILSIKNFSKVKKEIKKVKFPLIYKTIYLITLLFIILSFVLLKQTFPMLIMLILILILPFLFLIIKATESVCMFKTIPIEKLTEGDWITKSITINNKEIYSSSSPGIEKHQIEELLKHKSKIKEVTIKEGIPFVPSFLFGVIITLIYGNLIYFI